MYDLLLYLFNKIEACRNCTFKMEYRQKILTSISTKRKEVKMLVEINEEELLLLLTIVLTLKVL